MSLPFSRTASAATLAYAAYALARPRHLGRVMSDDPGVQADYDRLARAYGARDLAIGATGLLARPPAAVRAALAVRMCCDVSDGVLLSSEVDDTATRGKLLGVTFGWAAVNALAWYADARRAERG